jgi:hypothetical protein
MILFLVFFLLIVKALPKYIFAKIVTGGLKKLAVGSNLESKKTVDARKYTA